MSFFSKKETNEKNKSIISQMLDDLTTLEINTIIKESMSAADPPEDVGIMLHGLLEGYKSRIDVILYDNGLSQLFDADKCNTYEKLFNDIKSILAHLKENGIRLEMPEYNRLMRMQSFCQFIDYRSNVKDINARINVYDVDTKKELTPINKFEFVDGDYSHFKFTVYTRDLVKIKRFYDLGNEEIIMQTRFGIDGDVVTRVGRSFSNNPKDLIIHIHDQHTQLSVGYWTTLVTLVTQIVEKIFRKY